MKTLFILLSIFVSFFAYGQNKPTRSNPCVVDSALINHLNTQNSYYFQIPPDFSFQICYSENCLSPTAKAKILSLLKGESYDFKKELNKNKAEYYSFNSEWAKDELKWRFKGDSTRLAQRLDSLYQPMRAEDLAQRQANEYSEELIRFVGFIYLYDAIPFLRMELLTPKRYASKSKQEYIKQTLARLGDTEWLNYYLKKCQKLKYTDDTIKNYKDFKDLSYTVRYINNSTINKIFYKKSLTSNKIGFSLTSESGNQYIIWRLAIHSIMIFVNESNATYEILNRKFGKSLDQMYYEDKKDIDTETIRKGLFEILESCKSDFLVDYSQKPKK